MSVKSIARDLGRRMGAVTHAETVDGVDYIITLDTGEHSYGRDGGGGAAFAYEAVDVSLFLDEAPEGRISYSEDFCAAVSPVSDRGLAVAVAARYGWRLTYPGACAPVLSDDEYAMVRAAADAVRAA